MARVLTPGEQQLLNAHLAAAATATAWRISIVGGVYLASYLTGRTIATAIAYASHALDTIGAHRT